MSGIVQTVLGAVDPSDLGHTLTHEHLSMDFSYFYRPPPKTIKNVHTFEFPDSSLQTHGREYYEPHFLRTLGHVRQYPYSSRSNLILNDAQAKAAVMNDVEAFRKFGGGTIVENSTEGLQRDVTFYKQVAKDTGVHVVAGTGYYIADLQTAHVLHNYKEELYEQIVEELSVGCKEDKTVKAGFIGEIASVWPLRDFERKVIQAAGEAQQQIGCGVSFHPHRVPDAPFEIIRLYLEAGGRANKAVMSHLDRTLLNEEKLMEFSELGTYCQFDLFGVEVSYYQLSPETDMPSDAQRLDKIKLLVGEGKADKILMSHDIHTKHRLLSFGGHGYGHIINNVVPRMKARGFTRETITKITVENPAKWLTIPA